MVFEWIRRTNQSITKGGLFPREARWLLGLRSGKLPRSPPRKPLQQNVQSIPSRLSLMLWPPRKQSWYRDTPRQPRPPQYNCSSQGRRSIQGRCVHQLRPSRQYSTDPRRGGLDHAVSPTLKKMLEMRLGHEAKIWRDEKLQ